MQLTHLWGSRYNIYTDNTVQKSKFKVSSESQGELLAKVPTKDCEQVTSFQYIHNNYYHPPKMEEWGREMGMGPKRHWPLVRQAWNFVVPWLASRACSSVNRSLVGLDSPAL